MQAELKMCQVIISTKASESRGMNVLREAPWTPKQNTRGPLLLCSHCTTSLPSLLRGTYENCS